MTGRTPAGRTAAKHATSARRTPFVLLILGLVVGGMCVLLALNTASAANELARHGLASQDESIAAQVVQLENEVAASAAPGNLESAAAQLGMVPAGNPAFLVVGANGTVRLMGSPGAASAVPVYVAPTSTSVSKKPKPTATNSKTDTGSRTSTAKPTNGAKSTGTTSTGTASTSAAKPSPRPTPTPNTTLPGGNR